MKLSKRYEASGLDTERSLVRLAELHLAYGDQRTAARILDAEIKRGRVRGTSKNLNRLGDMWLLLREWERARSVLQQVHRPDSAVDFKIAWTWFGQKQWDSAETHLRRALRKGGLRTPCRTQMLLGHVLSKRMSWAAAIKEYERAEQSGECSPHGRVWAAYAGELRSQENPGAQAGETASVLKACRTGMFELWKDEAARTAANDALKIAREMRNTESAPELTRRASEFGSVFLGVLGRLNSGAAQQAAGHIAADERLHEQIRSDMSQLKLHRLVHSCIEEVHQIRIAVLEEAQQTISTAETAANKAPMRR